MTLHFVFDQEGFYKEASFQRSCVCSRQATMVVKKTP